MPVKIASKIVSYSVAAQPADAVAKPVSSPEATAKPQPAAAPIAPAPAAPPVVVQMHEKLERPEVLSGQTYKVKSPLFEHALYVTITDIVLNAGTQWEQKRPFEIFVNSKNMEQFQWVVALTRVMSAVFRKGGDVTFLVEELAAVFDPKGGYYKPGGVYVPSLVAELGSILERHLTAIGLLHAPELSGSQKELIAAKRAAYEARQQQNQVEQLAPRPAPPEPVPGAELAARQAQLASSEENDTGEDAGETEPTFPPGATQCSKCHKQALVHLDNCDCCLNCGYSHCA